jgi:predicted transcriptional regulator
MANGTLPAISDALLLDLTARIAASYLSTHQVDTAEVPSLILGVHRSLAGLNGNGISAPSPHRAARDIAAPAVKDPASAIDPRKSVFRDHLLCIECGKRLVTLRRHLDTAHRVTPAEYRTKWSLPDNYPIVAPDYTKTRSKLAKQLGLGKKGRPRSR